MDVTTYQKEALKTANPLETAGHGVGNCLMGLMGEAGEIADVYKKIFYHKKNILLDAIVGEVGDLMWYIAVLCHYLDLSLPEIYTLAIEMNLEGADQLWHARNIYGEVYFLSANFSGWTDLEANLLYWSKGSVERSIAVIIAHLREILRREGRHIPEALDKNIAKLRARHGESWSGGQYDSKSEG